MSGSLPTLSVSRLVSLLKETVEDNFVQVLVEGEISNFAAPSSGHWYFSLKDENAQLRAVIFRPQARLLRFKPENGMQVVCTGRVSVYSQRGELQLILESLEPMGVGSLQLAFEQLKARLASEGLFEQSRKKNLPLFPVTVGVVTSSTGAAIHDILNVLRRRSSGISILLAPVRVQGEGAAEEIARAIEDHNRLNKAEVLIVGRGGGSLEDLWAFNEERVARAICASRIPVISAVGHEVDFTIADFVADLRAPTPSAAAELVVKNRLELEGHVDHLVMRLGSRMQARVAMLRLRADGLERRLRSPRQELARLRERYEALTHRLRQGGLNACRLQDNRLSSMAGRLEALSPLKVLGRGYSIVFDETTGRALRSSRSVRVGDGVKILLAQGAARARIEEVDP